MKNTLLKGLGFIAVVGLISCVSERGKPKLTYYHGLRPPDVYFTVVDYSPAQIEFEIRVSFRGRHMYHLVLEDDEPLAEGWYPTALIGEKFYRVKMKAKKGVSFQPGKSYRLCIGEDSPELAARYRDSYRCAADYEFVLPKK